MNRRDVHGPFEIGGRDAIGELGSSGAVHGEAAAACGRALLMEATGTDNIEDAVRSALGEPQRSEGGDPRN